MLFLSMRLVNVIMDFLERPESYPRAAVPNYNGNRRGARAFSLLIPS
jgi:hypothetical protein